MKFYIWHKRNNTSVSNGGFTLIEILVTIAVLLIGAAAIVGSVAVGQRVTKRANDFVNAAVLGNKLANEALSVGFAGIADETGTVNNIVYSTTITTATAASGLYKIIEISLTWKERNRDREEKLVTYVPDLD